jgi:hypothetical protein
MDQICSNCNARDEKFWDLGDSNIRTLTDRTETFRGFCLYLPTNYGGSVNNSRETTALPFHKYTSYFSLIMFERLASCCMSY